MADGPRRALRARAGTRPRSGFAAIVIVCAVIYLLAAVTRRPGSAWIGFAASILLVGLSIFVDTQWPSVAAIGALGIVLFVIGLFRGTWRSAINRWQLVGAAVFGAIAVVSLVAPAAGHRHPHRDRARRARRPGTSCTTPATRSSAAATPSSARRWTSPSRSS